MAKAEGFGFESGDFFFSGRMEKGDAGDKTLQHKSVMNPETRASNRPINK